MRDKSFGMIKFPDKLKKILASKAFAVALFIALMLFLVFWMLHMRNFSYNHSGNYNQTVKTESGASDFTDIDLQTSDSNIVLGGEWQFYYNKWIITDESESESDGLIYVPSRWTGMSFNGGHPLPRGGFASYALTLQNVSEGQHIAVRMPRCDTSYRVFANGTLITTYGIMSKDAAGTRITYDYEQPNTYITPAKEDVFIVVEISEANLGGLNDCPTVAMMGVGASSPTYYFINNSPLLFAGIVLSSTIINLIMVFSLFGEKKEWTTVAFLIAVFLHYAFSKGMFFVLLRFFITTPPTVFYILNMLSGCFMLISMLWHFRREKATDFSKRTQIVLAAVIGVFYLAFFLMTGSVWQMIPFFLLLAIMAVILYRLLRAMQKRVRFSFIYTFFMVLSMVVFIYEGMDFWSGVVFDSSLPVTLLVTSVSIIMSIIYFVRMRQNTVGAMKVMQLEKDYTEMRHATMLAQIKPHFVFNSLTSIQSMYHESLDEGDTALTYFSKHLRSNIESDTHELIPFEEELLNINNYFLLENMRLENKLTLLFDIGYFDFNVPILSLQPLIENAIKYAKTETKENGYIQIISRSEEGRIVVTVKDNGIGFDTAAIKPSSKGLANITERFKYCLNAEIVIDSKTDEGTSVSIVIPHANAAADVDKV